MIDKIFVLVVTVLTILLYDYLVIKPMQEQMEHINSVVFESSRCPTNKSFSLFTLRP